MRDLRRGLLLAPVITMMGGGRPERIRPGAITIMHSLGGVLIAAEISAVIDISHADRGKSCQQQSLAAQALTPAPRHCRNSGLSFT